MREIKEEATKGGQLSKEELKIALASHLKVDKSNDIFNN